MKLSFIFIYLGFIVSAKKPKSLHYDDHDYDSDVEEYPPPVKTVLNLAGTMRQKFALEAALLDHARNMICSPLSALMPLAKLTAGSKKKASRELLQAIGLKSRREIKGTFRELIKNMEYLPGVTLDVASRVYISSEKDINAKFLRRTKTVFKSSCQKISTRDPERTAESINEWVASKTRNKITHLISSNDIGPDTSVVLVNAIYFAGTWRDPFRRTYTGEFFSPSGARRIPMMTNQQNYNYWKSDTLNAELIEIPYEGEQCSMIIVLPYTTSGLPALLHALKLAPQIFNSALKKMRSETVILSMPKFKIETEFDLNKLYKKIGLRNIFDDQKSDLTGIIEDDRVFVSKSVHKAIIEVNERGTEAAAATGVVVQHLSAVLNIPIFNANRPFMFYIVAHREQVFAGIFSG